MNVPTPEGAGELPFPATSEYGDAMDALDIMDRTRLEYLEACADFKNTAGKKEPMPVLIAMGTYTAAFVNLVHLLPREGGYMDFCKSLGYLYAHQDHMRVDYLNGMLGCALLQKSEFEVMDEDAELVVLTTEEEIEAKEKAAAQFIDFFQSGLVVDTNKYIAQLKESELSRGMSTREKAIRHALDVGKITLGTALGIWVAKSRRRN